MTTIAMSHVVQPTAACQRQLLQNAGFVHVTGLIAESFIGSDKTPIGHDLRPRDLGKYGSNNHTDVIITMGGEVWLACQTKESMNTRHESIRDALSALCPNGGGAWVPCSNGEELPFRDVLKRMADPDFEPSY